MVDLKETITVPGNIAAVEQVRVFLRVLIARMSLPEEPAYHLELAVTEACFNIVRYAYAQSPGEIHVSLWLSSGRVYVEIRDSGRFFDPRQVKPPDLDRYIREGVKGGFGVFLMSRLMEGLDYRREKDGNVLTLWKTLAR